MPEDEVDDALLLLLLLRPKGERGVCCCCAIGLPGKGLVVKGLGAIVRRPNLLLLPSILSSKFKVLGACIIHHIDPSTCVEQQR